MSDYFTDFGREIFDGIKKMVISSDGNIIDQNECISIFLKKVRHVKDCNGIIFFCGNGASCTMAEHLSHDWFQNGKVNTYTCSETAHLTAIANDLSYDDVFSFRIERVLGPNDMLITVSSSGNSPNITKAIETAKRKGSYVVTLSGMKQDNKSRANGDLNIWVPLDTYGGVETAHALVLHELLDEYMNCYEGGRH